MTTLDKDINLYNITHLMIPNFVSNKCEYAANNISQVSDLTVLC